MKSRTRYGQRSEAITHDWLNSRPSTIQPTSSASTRTWRQCADRCPRPYSCNFLGARWRSTSKAYAASNNHSTVSRRGYAHSPAWHASGIEGIETQRRQQMKNRHPRVSASVVGAAAIVLLASVSTSAHAAEDSTRISHACAAVMGFDPSEEPYEDCVRASI